MNTEDDLKLLKQRIHLLSKARNIVNEEHMQKRLAAQQKWREDSHHMWITQGILLPYPSALDMPTEQEIIDKALELYNAATKPEDKQQKQENTNIPPPNVEPIHGPVPIEPPPIEQPAEPEPPPVEPVPELTLAQLSEKERQNAKLRTLLAQFVTTAKTLDSESRKEPSNDDAQ